MTRLHLNRTAPEKEAVKNPSRASRAERPTERRPAERPPRSARPGTGAPRGRRPPDRPPAGAALFAQRNPQPNQRAPTPNIVNMRQPPRNCGSKTRVRVRKQWFGYEHHHFGVRKKQRSGYEKEPNVHVSLTCNNLTQRGYETTSLF